MRMIKVLKSYIANSYTYLYLTAGAPLTEALLHALRCRRF